MAELNLPPSEELVIYIGYDRLRSTDLGRILINLSAIADIIAEDYFLRIDNYGGKELPTLDVNTIHTGNSNKVNMVEGWLPEVKTVDGEFVISIPKKLGLPVMLGYALLFVFEHYLDDRKTMVETQKDKVELALKEIELAKALGEHGNIDQSMGHYLNEKVPVAKALLLDTTKMILNNKDIRQFR